MISSVSERTLLTAKLPKPRSLIENNLVHGFETGITSRKPTENRHGLFAHNMTLKTLFVDTLCYV